MTKKPETNKSPNPIRQNGMEKRKYNALTSPSDIKYAKIALVAICFGKKGIMRVITLGTELQLNGKFRPSHSVSPELYIVLTSFAKEAHL